MFKNIVSAVALILVLTGCVSSNEYFAKKREYALKSNSSPAYADGFVDGCKNSKSPSDVVKNSNRYIHDKYYKAGWDDGHMQCTKEDKMIEDNFQAVGDFFGAIAELGQ